MKTLLVWEGGMTDDAAVLEVDGKRTDRWYFDNSQEYADALERWKESIRDKLRKAGWSWEEEDRT